MTVEDILQKYNLTQTALSNLFGIPRRTVQNWVSDTGNARKCPEYVVRMMDMVLSNEHYQKTWEQEIQEYKKFIESAPEEYKHHPESDTE